MNRHKEIKFEDSSPGRLGSSSLQNFASALTRSLMTLIGACIGPSKMRQCSPAIVHQRRIRCTAALFPADSSSSGRIPEKNADRQHQRSPAAPHTP